MSNFELQETLEGGNQLDPNMGYMVDFTSLKSVNDLVMVLSAMAISFPGNHPLIQHLKPFLNLQNPFPIQQPDANPFQTIKD